MAYKPKSKRTNSPVGPQGKKLLDGLTANKNIDDIRALSKISNTQSTSISNLNTEINSANQRISQISTSKQDKLTLTTVGTSGPATLNNNTLNVPNYSTGLTVNTTTITGGVSGRLLFDNSGILGETSGINWSPTTSTLSLFDSPFVSQAGNLSANTSFSITGTASSNYTISSSRQFIFNTGQSMYFNTDTDGGSALDRAWYFAGARTGMTGGRTYGALTVDSSGFPSFTLYNNDNGPRILLASNATSYFNGGNLLVGTTTDAGFRFDVAGTIRSQGSLFISNPSFTLGGSITHSANATLVITGGPGGGSENITFGPSNRIFINAGQTWASQTFLIGGASSVGAISNPGIFSAIHLITGTSTAASAIARAQYINTTLVQSVANDVLTAVQITPTFTVNNTLFHEAYWMRLTGSYAPAAYTINNNATSIDLSNSFTNTFNAIGIRIRHTYGNVQNGYGILLESAGFIGIAQTSLTSTNFLAGTTVIGSSVVDTVAGYTLHVTNNTNGAIKVGSANQANEHLVISHSQAGSTFSSIRNTFAATGATMLIDVAGQNNLRLFGTGNVAINNTTDAGYKLDVNGTVRVKGTGTTSATSAFTVQNSAGANLLKMFDDRSLMLGVFGSNNYLYFSDNGSGAAIKSDSYSMIFNTRSYGNVFNFTQGGNIDTAPIIAQLSNLNYSVNTPTLIGAISTASSSAQLEVVSTNRGFLPPRMSNAQMLAIATPSEGLVVYDLTNRKLCCYDGGTWQNLF